MTEKRLEVVANTYAHKCPRCGQDFKRPCDLTKHEKTHNRPYKCHVDGCKYREYGWSTKGALDRHVNDRHCLAPPVYPCLYKPCPYTSKRESNCKQHMEKTHGWQYLRSKNNGINQASGARRFGSVPAADHLRSKGVTARQQPPTPPVTVDNILDDHSRIKTNLDSGNETSVTLAGMGSKRQAPAIDTIPGMRLRRANTANKVEHRF
jgi:uncharacterized C2H2 Zn-finger protein